MSWLAANTDDSIVGQMRTLCGSHGFVINATKESNHYRAAGYVVPPTTADATGKVGTRSPLSPVFAASLEGCACSLEHCEHSVVWDKAGACNNHTGQGTNEAMG
jgi:hypothetical protein